MEGSYNAKVTLVEDKLRRIASREHNIYVVEGIDAHKATRVAPPGLLQPFTSKAEEEITSRHRMVEKVLNQSLGRPFYSDTGFILYEGDAVRLLGAMCGVGFNVDLTVTSPPYNIGKEYEHAMRVEDYVEWCARWMRQVYDMTKNDGAFWLNVGYCEVPEKGLCVPIPYLLWDRSPFYLLQEIVWKYGAGDRRCHTAKVGQGRHGQNLPAQGLSY